MIKKFIIIIFILFLYINILFSQNWKILLIEIAPQESEETIVWIECVILKEKDL